VDIFSNFVNPYKSLKSLQFFSLIIIIIIIIILKNIF